MKRGPSILTTLALSLALALTAALSFQGTTSANSSDCPQGTVFVAKYEPTASGSLFLASGAGVITFSDLVSTGAELKRFDFISTVPIAFVYVKAGTDPGDS